MGNTGSKSEGIEMQDFGSRVGAERDAARIFTRPPTTTSTSIEHVAPSITVQKQQAQTKTGNKTPGKVSSFFWPYLIGFLSGVLIAYIITILMGYIINKSASASSGVRTAFYGYLVGCQGA